MWCVPLFLFGLRIINPGAGWETLGMLMFLPIWYPILALVCMIPRRVWRNRSGKVAQPPALLLGAMVLFWVGMFLSFVSLRGMADSGSVASALGESLPAFDARGEGVVFTIGALLAVIGLIGALVWAGAARVGRAPRRAGWLAIAVPIALVPLAVLAGWLVQFALMSTASDPAGRTEFAASRMTVVETATANTGYWEETQQATVPLRAALADDGWRISFGGVVSDDRDRARRVVASGSWAARSTEPAEVLAERARAALAEGGWAPDPESGHRWGWLRENDPLRSDTEVSVELHDPEAVGDLPTIVMWSRTDDGFLAQLQFWTVEETGATGIHLTVSGPSYWKGPYVTWYEPEVREAFGDAEVQHPAGGYRATEWPELGPIERTVFPFDDADNFPGEHTA